jgi:outer membrane lipoprotein-sorting protein
MKLVRTLMVGLTLAAAPFAAAPVSAQTAAISAADRSLVDKAAAYLQGLGSATGRFVQTDPRGATSQGTYYLSRPGKIRFEYDKPSGLLVVADGNNVNIFDPRLKTFDRYPQGATPLGLFLAKQVKLDGRIRVERVTRTQDGFELVLRDSRRPQDGSIALRFDETPMRLTEWTVTDGRGQRTRVRLTSLQPSGGFAKNLFVLRDPNPRPGPRKG